MSEKKTTNRIKLIFNTLIRALKHAFLHNGWLKLLAVLISVFIWAGLISQDESLTRDKTFNNVNVNISGSDTAKRNGYIVISDLDELLDNVTCVAAVPQKQYENADASVYNIRLDLSRINSPGTQELKISSTNSATYGRITSTTPSSVTVNVEEYIMRQRIPVSVSTIGEVPTGWYMSSITVDPALISVSGPKLLVQAISRAKVILDRDTIEWKEGTMITSADIMLYNRNGEVVSSSLLDVTTESLTIDTVLLEFNILPTKSVDVTEYINTTGTVAENYTVKDIRISPENITVAARSEVLEQMNELTMEGNTLNLKNLSETTVFQLKIQKPSDDAIISNDTVTVTVEIGPKDEES